MRYALALFLVVLTAGGCVSAEAMRAEQARQRNVAQRQITADSLMALPPGRLTDDDRAWLDLYWQQQQREQVITNSQSGRQQQAARMLIGGGVAVVCLVLLIATMPE